MKNIVFEAMELAKENREFYIKADNYYCRILQPSNGIYSINLGRQVGHTTGAVQFANKYPNRCVFVSTKKDWVNNLHKLYGLDKGVLNINLAGKSIYEQLRDNPELTKGRDIIIVDMFSFLTKNELDKVSGLVYALVEATNLPIFAYYQIQ